MLLFFLGSQEEFRLQLQLQFFSRCCVGIKYCHVAAFLHGIYFFRDKRISDFSSSPWQILPLTWVIHMATPQTSPQHADPYGFLVWFSLERHQVHVDRRVVGWSAGRHVDHPCGGQISPWPARKVTERRKLVSNGKILGFLRAGVPK